MDVLKLVIIFAVVIVMINLKVPLSAAILTATVLGCILYQMGFVGGVEAICSGVFSSATWTLLIVTYVITFLQRMMESRGTLKQAQMCLSGLFNNRRINASVAPIFVGLLPGAAVAFIAADMVDDACGDYLDRDEKAFVTSYFRHIPESCLPTYSTIILAASLAGVSLSGFLLSMIIPVILLYTLGYMFYLRKVPKETGVPPAEDKAAEWKKLFLSLWTLILAIGLVIVMPYIPFSKVAFIPAAVANFLNNFPVWLAVIISIVIFFFTDHFSVKEILPYFYSAIEWRLVSNIIVVMAFKGVLTASGVITKLPEVLSLLPIPMFMIFALIFLFGSIVGGTQTIVTLCTTAAFAAIPDGGVPLMMLLMSYTYAAMQISPTHVCVTMIAEYCHSSFGAMVKKTLPVIISFMVLIIPYYLLLSFLF